MFVGQYENHKHDGTVHKNNWHYVTITHSVTRHTYTWKNRAGVSWTLYPKSSSELRVGTDCPYYKNGHKVARFTSVGVYGPWGELYERTGDPSKSAGELNLSYYCCDLPSIYSPLDLVISFV